jgi:hypothetical protein
MKYIHVVWNGNLWRVNVSPSFIKLVNFFKELFTMEVDLSRFLSDVPVMLTRVRSSLSWLNATWPNVTDVVS